MRLFLMLLLGLMGVLPAAAQQGGSLEEGSLRIAWRYLPGEAPGLGMLEVEAADAASGAPVRYDRGRLAAWLQRRRASLPEAETACTDKVRALASQGIGRRADIDLNAYRLLTLNTDGTLAVINPFVGLNNAKLESIVELGGTPTAWLPLLDRLEIWVVLASPARLVSVDLHSRRITRAIALPETEGPASLVWDAGSRRLWLGLPGVAAGLGWLEPDRPAGALQVVPGAGPIGLFTDPAGRLPGLVALGPDGTVTLKGESEVRGWPLPGRPRLARYSALAGRLLVATEAGLLAWIDPAAAAGTLPERIQPLGHPIRALTLFDGERRILALGDGQASVVDLASGEISLRLAAPSGADEILFTDRFAYALSTRDGRATLWLIEDLRQGKAQPIEVTLGRPDPAAAPGFDNPPRAVAIPAGSGLVAANPADGMLYQYGEGMMAPIGSYSNYRRAALGLALLDLSLREVAPGRYRSPLRHIQGGPYELVLSGIAPRFAHCATLTLAPLPAGTTATPEPPLRPELVGVAAAGSLLRILTVRLHQAGRTEAVTGVPDLVLLAFDRRTGEQSRAPLTEVAPGEYQARLRLSQPGGRYELLAASASRNLAFVEGRLGSLPAVTGP